MNSRVQQLGQEVMKAIRSLMISNMGMPQYTNNDGQQLGQNVMKYTRSMMISNMENALVCEVERADI